MDTELKKELKKINWKRHNIQNIPSGEQYVSKDNIVFIEGGGGQSTKKHLDVVADKGGKVVTIDLCTSRDDKIIWDDTIFSGGWGNYKSKKELFKELEENPIIKKYFNFFYMPTHAFWIKMKNDIEFRKDILNGQDGVDYYFDDATHESNYLIPLFKIVIELCNDGAIIGSHDMKEREMVEFLGWMEENKQLTFFRESQSSRFYKVKK